MVGKLNPNSRTATIIGGGISGLLAAYYLVRSGFQVTVYEAGPRWGGLIQTRHHSLGIAEAAAHSILVTPQVKSLFDELEVPLTEVNPTSKARWIVRKGQMSRFPLSWTEALGTFFKAALSKSNSDRALTLGAWTQCHLGRPALNYLIDPILKGIFGASPDQILVRLAFPSLSVPPGRTLVGHLFRRWWTNRQLDKKSPRSKMMAPVQGMESLIHSLVRFLESQPGVSLQLNHPIDALPNAENLIIAVPPPQAAKLLKTRDPNLSRALSDLKWSSLITTTVFLPKNRLSKVPQGVGVLMPSLELRNCLGILFNSSAFSNRVTDPSLWISLTVMCAYPSPGSPPISHADVLAKIQPELEALFGWQGPIENAIVTCWPAAIPLYDCHLDRALDLAREGWCSKPGQILAGNYTGEVSIRGMIESTAVQFGPSSGSGQLGSK